MDFVNENEVGFSRKVKEVAFGFWVLSPKYHTITDGDIQRELEPLLFGLLTYFIKHNDRIVSRQELVDEVWKQAYVDDNAINRAISELRKVLKSEKQRAQVIKTHYKKGYSFALEVNVVYHEVSQNKTSKTEPAVSLPSQKGPNSFTGGVGASHGHFSKMFGLLVVVACFVFIYFYYFDAMTDEESLPPLTASSTLLSWKKGTSLTPKISKDLKYLAYAFRESGTRGFNLHIKLMDSLKEFKVAENNADVFPIGWSANRDLYYQLAQLGDDPTCEIWKVNLIDNVVDAKHDKLFDCQSSQIVSADAINNGNTFLYTKYNYRGHKNLSAIVSRDIDSGNEYQVSSPNITTYGDYYVKASNDETKVVFLRSIEAGTSIFLANIDGSNQKKLQDLDYYVSSISWEDSDAAISWMDTRSGLVSTMNLETKDISKIKIDSEYSFDNTFGFQLVNRQRALVATDYIDANILEVELNTPEISATEFSNTDMHETLVTPYHSSDGGIYLVGRNSKSVWKLEDQTRQKLLDLDFSDITDIEISSDDEHLLIARTHELIVYRLSDLKKMHNIQLDGIIRNVSWTLPSKLFLTYNEKDIFNFWLYDLDEDRLVKLNNTLVKSASMIDEVNVLFLDRQDRLQLQNIESGENNIIRISGLTSSIDAWTADKHYFYYSADGKSVYRKPINTGGDTEKLFELDNKAILKLAVSESDKKPKLYMTVSEFKDNLLIELGF